MEVYTTRGIRILIDDEDLPKANNGKALFVKDNGFVIISRRTSRTTGKHVYLHKEIMGVGRGVQVDHVNRNRLFYISTGWATDEIPSNCILKSHLYSKYGWLNFD